MIMTILRTRQFTRWFDGLSDRRAVASIAIRIDRLADGHAGDARPVGDGISELRINQGPGYRIYYIQRGEVTIILLAGGDKSSQVRDIAAAKKLLREWKGYGS